MSSSALPTLVIDLASLRGQRQLALAAWGLGALAFLWGLPGAWGLLLGSCVFFMVGAGLMRAGWLGGGRRLVRLVCQADGHWRLCDACGRAIQTQLSPASRVSTHALWLRWQANNSPPLLLLPGDIPPADFRRLVVRLRWGAFPSAVSR